jgi:transmembrane sensor
MIKEDILKLIRKYFENRISDPEMEMLYRMVNSPKGEAELIDLFDSSEWTDLYANTNEIDSKRILGNIKSKIRKKKNYSKRLFFSFGWAAIVILAVGIGVILYSNSNTKSKTLQLVQTNIIAEPGKVTKIILPDSSTVWLNSGSRLSYDSQYGISHREVTLIGQAFMDVVQNKGIPFIVGCDLINVKVLGTRFDVETFPGMEQVRIVLESGKVELTHKHIDTFKHLMSPGDLAVYNQKENNLTLKQVNVENFTSWVSGKFVFRDEPLALVFETIERMYNIDIDYNYPDISRSMFTATITNETIEDVLKLIELTCQVECQVQTGNNNEMRKYQIIKK